MKKRNKFFPLIVFCLAIFFVPFLTFAEPGNPNPIHLKNNLYSIDFVNPNQGWAVGYYGTIIHTEDGGKSWTYQKSGKTTVLTSVDFVDPNNGWAVGYGPTILHTTDGGKTWSDQKISEDIFLTAVYFLNEKKGWIVGEWGTILVTEDGGNTWNSQLSGGDAVLYDVCFSDELHGWAVGEFGAIFSTEDGGKTWVNQASGVENVFFSCKALDSQNVWAVGIDSLVIHSADGGKSWARVDSGLKTRVPFYEIFFKDPGHAVICGQGTVLYTDDGGTKWNPSKFKDSIQYSWLYGMSAADNNIWMVGENLRVFKSATNGKEWEEIAINE